MILKNLFLFCNLINFSLTFASEKEEPEKFKEPLISFNLTKINEKAHITLSLPKDIQSSKFSPYNQLITTDLILLANSNDKKAQKFIIQKIQNGIWDGIENNISIEKWDNVEEKALKDARYCTLMILNSWLPLRIKEHIENRANTDEVISQFNLGLMYQDGIEVTQDYFEAFKMFNKAAIQGLALGQLNLGYMYQKGRGVDQDDTKAFEYYEKAAIQGLALGQLNLGYMYQKGRGVDQDDTKAFEYYEKAAIQGLAAAQVNLGLMHKNSKENVKENYSNAFKCFNKAAIQGYKKGQKARSLMYAEGAAVVINTHNGKDEF